ncbi:hypothetical protein ANN_04496, partial [Periplaneta americana]
SPRVRGWALWRYVRDYFPVRLVNTAELDPTLSYMFCVFPHGVLSMGSGVNFATNANNVDEIFPNHKCYLATLPYHFKLFYGRELGHALGFCPATPKCVSNVLSRPNSVLVLIVGGAAESMYSRPGQYTIFLKHRKGFVKMALKHGTPLVPVFTFGEPDTYDQIEFPEGSWFRRFQEYIRKIITFAPIIAYGNGPLPYRRELITVGKTKHFPGKRNNVEFEESKSCILRNQESILKDILLGEATDNMGETRM